MQQETSNALSQFDRAFVAALDHNRALMESAAGFLRGESFRFITLRLDRTRDAMDQLSECRDLSGLLSVQKEWIGDLMQDVAAQNHRYQEFWSHGAERMRAEMERHAENAQQAASAAMEEATGSAEAAAEATHDAVHGAVEQTAQNFSEAQDAFQPPNTHSDQYH